MILAALALNACKVNSSEPLEYTTTVTGPDGKSTTTTGTLGSTSAAGTSAAGGATPDSTAAQNSAVASEAGKLACSVSVATNAVAFCLLYKAKISQYVANAACFGVVSASCSSMNILGSCKTNPADNTNPAYIEFEYRDYPEKTEASFKASCVKSGGTWIPGK